MKLKNNYLLMATIKSKAIWQILLTMFAQIMIQVIVAGYTYQVSVALTGNGSMKTITWVGILMLIQVFFTAIASRFRSINHLKVWNYMMHEFVEKIINADYTFYTKFSSGELISVCNSIHGLSKTVKMEIFMIDQVCSILINIAAIGLISPIAIIPIVILYGIASLVVYRLVKKNNILNSQLDKNGRERIKYTDDSICGFAEIKTFTQEKTRIKKLKDFISIGADILNKRSNIEMVIETVMDSGDGIVTMILLLMTITMVHKGMFTGDVAISIIMYAWRLYGPIENILWNI